MAADVSLIVVIDSLSKGIGSTIGGMNHFFQESGPWLFITLALIKEHESSPLSKRRIRQRNYS
jgi:hypothetical protein